MDFVDEQAKTSILLRLVYRPGGDNILCPGLRDTVFFFRHLPLPPGGIQVAAGYHRYHAFHTYSHLWDHGPHNGLSRGSHWAEKNDDHGGESIVPGVNPVPLGESIMAFLDQFRPYCRHGLVHDRGGSLYYGNP